MEKVSHIHTKKEDTVNNPSHYTNGKEEVIEIIDKSLSDQEYVGYLKGNILKYLLRAGKKKGTAATEDMGKATWYINRLHRRLFTIEHENNIKKNK